MSGKHFSMGDKTQPRLDDPEFLSAEAKRMAEFLIADTDAGGRAYIGDRIRDAAIRHRVEASILKQACYKPARDWKVSRWFSLFAAYHRAAQRKADAAYATKRIEAEVAGIHPALLRLADLVSGNTDDEGGATDPADRSQR